MIYDPIEIMESKIDRLVDDFVDERTCMNCGNKVDYDLICIDPMGCGPTICFDCLPDEYKEYFENN